MLWSVPICRLPQTRPFFVKIPLWCSLSIIRRQNLVECSLISVDEFLIFTLDMSSSAGPLPFSWLLGHKVLSLTTLLWLYILNHPELWIYSINEIFSDVRLWAVVLIAEYCLFILEELLSRVNWSAVAMLIHFSVWSLLVDLWLIFLSGHVDLAVRGITSKQKLFLVSYRVAHDAFTIQSSQVFVHMDFIRKLTFTNKWLMTCPWWHLL